MKQLQLPARFLHLAVSLLLVLSLRCFVHDGLALGTAPARVWSLWPLLLAYAAGSVIPVNKHTLWLVFPVSGLCLFLQEHPVTPGADAVLDVLSAAALFVLGRGWREGKGPGLAVPALGLYAFTALRQYLRGESTQRAGLLALLLALLYLLSSHAQGLQAGLHNMSGEAPMAWPKGVRAKNALMVLGFFALVLGLAAISPIQRGADQLFGGAVHGVRSISVNVSTGIKEQMMATPTPDPKPTPARTPKPEEEDEAYIPPSPWVRVFFLLVFVLPALLLAVVFLAFMPAELKKALFRLRRRRGRGRREEAPPEDSEEEQEKLRSWRDLLRSARKRMKLPLGPGRRRLRYRDLTDDRQRIRFAYRELLRSPRGKALSPAMTPREVARELTGEAVQELVRQYDLARYAPGRPLAPNAAEIAARSLRKGK